MSRRKTGGFVGLLFIGGMGYALWYFIKGKGAGITTAAKSLTADTSATAPAELPQAPPPIYAAPQLVQVAPPASQPAPTTTTTPAPAPAPQLVQVAPPASQPAPTTTTTPAPAPAPQLVQVAPPASQPTTTTSSTAPCAAKPGDILIRACETGPLTRADLDRLGTFRRYNLDGSQDGNGWNMVFKNGAEHFYNQETGVKVLQRIVPDNAGVASKAAQYVAHKKAGTLSTLK